MTQSTAPVIHVHKAAGQRKNAVRIRNRMDIPDFLVGTIKVDLANEEIILNCCVEGAERAPLGSVIGYERSSKTSTGWNTWYIEDLSLIEERDDGFYTKAVILEAQEITEEAPEILRGANIWRNEDGSWAYGAEWGTQTGWPGQAYWVRSGLDNKGHPKGYILTKSEETFGLFIVCDDDERDICSLPEWDARVHA